MTAVNSWGSIQLLLAAYTACGAPSALQMCWPAAVVLKHTFRGRQLFFLHLHFIQEFFGFFWLSRAKWWLYGKSSDNDAVAATVAHLLTSSQWIQKQTKAQDAEKETRGREGARKRWKDCVVKDWPLLRFVSRSSALKVEERRERRRYERKRACERGGEKESEIERASRVKFPWTIPAFPTRLIKLWLC